jgi:phage replication-related protein YjqB (UPF0714/DUF867 family)
VSFAVEGGRLVIAGGSLETGSASDAVYTFSPGTHAVTRVGRLPAPTDSGLHLTSARCQSDP